MHSVYHSVQKELLHIVVKNFRLLFLDICGHISNMVLSSGNNLNEERRRKASAFQYILKRGYVSQGSKTATVTTALSAYYSLHDLKTFFSYPRNLKIV